jgi:hypothetical protein
VPRTTLSQLPGCPQADAAPAPDACRELLDWMTAQLAGSKQLVGRIGAKVQIVDLRGANSFMFLSNGPEVAAAVRAFVSDLTP